MPQPPPPSVEIGEQELGLAPVVPSHPQRYIATAEAIDRPISGEDGFDPSLFQCLMPSPRSAHVAEITHDLPDVELRVIDMNRRLPWTRAPARKSKAIEEAHRSYLDVLLPLGANDPKQTRFSDRRDRDDAALSPTL